MDYKECSGGKHIHMPIEECQQHLRTFLDGRYGDIRDDQCCACYFSDESWGWVTVEGSEESGDSGGL